ncbi:hypothetical protein J437_LFUL005328 [Ladona fulva]|uniref:CUB domain-containing protein n=1 Tax=Ladona fulva TaxID=123851 RepID=A0A8K0JZ66_LADFU|nr:hypothetical protein J437_LFUL005328 [Ladona fulva]
MYEKEEVMLISLGNNRFVTNWSGLGGHAILRHSSHNVTATCGDEIKNNITYFVNPGFPGLHSDLMECEIKVEKMASHVSQIRLDFEHFNLGQPNRRTGNCDSDVFIMGATSSKKKNTLKFPSLYYDVENLDGPLTIRMDLKKENMGRLWEIKVTQVRFNQRAPSGCMQYYRGTTGMIQTMNFADNGRHLANQDYSICMRQEEGFCSIAYEPCDENSFKIGPPLPGGAGSLGGAGPLGTNPLGGGPLLDDAGSGFEGFFRTEEEVNSIARQGLAQGECADRIVMPCDSEEFIAADPNGPGVCDLLHCGSSFCNSGEDPCRIESSTTPFHIQVLFGPGVREESPDDNLGMCLRYEQLPCI